MMANQPAFHASFQNGAASDAALTIPMTNTKTLNAGAMMTSATTANTSITNTSIIGTATTNAPSLSAGQTFIQVSSALGGILLLIFFITWLIRRLGLSPARNKNHRLLNVKASCSLGPKERIVVVEIENSWLVLGVTSQQINVLHQLPVPSDNTEKETVLKTFPFGQLLKNTLQQKSKNNKDSDEK
ncbi:flagellar biosynthetic protein FliO [Xenorhabdus cabanillasii]|uniref:Flagellar protein n=1 Tax=Xenorhabdus cabanillasii JM26 TaxID=1427517 RepID=W1IY58_9GAMM|nr:flagellar biosynthetic protein FliO [Xenorhabdus cabanillasii]PHM75619.1 flagellar biosynthesis protein FliO [Xenorhabdus cabanillasii JM26]CDL82160.1 Protein mopB [Xenorhabdus cabanillasii JM26]